MNTTIHIPLRPLALAAAVLALAATSHVLAKDGGRPGPDGHRGGRPGRGLPPELAQKYDANGDGQLDATERATLDADIQAGKVPAPARRGPGGPGGSGAHGRPGAGAPPADVLAKFDANGDGQLDATEREALHKAVQAGEIEPPHGGRRGGPGGPGGPRGEGSGSPDRRARMLEKFDANHDGVLDEAERKAMHEARRADGPPAPPAPGASEAPASGPTVIRKGRRS